MSPALDERKGEMDNADAYEVLDACATMYDRQAYALRAEGYEQAAVTIYRKSTLLRSLRTCISELERRVEAAEAELGRLEKDAIRYQQLRNLCCYPFASIGGTVFGSHEACDAFCDNQPVSGAQT